MLRIIQGDCLTMLKTLETESVQCCVTSPPYWGLRTYDMEEQYGLEETFEQFLAKQVEVFEEVRRVLKNDGTAWVNMGNSYNSDLTRGSFGNQSKKAYTEHGSKRPTIKELHKKNLIGQAWKLAFAMQDAGWILRSDVIWYKTNPMPSSVADRPTPAHEYLFLLSKKPTYYYNADAIREDCVTGNGEAQGLISGKRFGAKKNAKGTVSGFGEREMVNPDNGRNKRSVWPIPTEPCPGDHPATFPTALVEPCLLAGSKKGDLILDPYSGWGTTALVAARLQRDFVGIELNPDYIEGARERIEKDMPLFNQVEVVA